MNEQRQNRQPATCQSLEWYAEGESRYVQAGDVRITVRFLCRHGRRGRILIEAPAGAVFCGGATGSDQRHPSE
jgi:hypothetical protein